jgi:hypothetical protein
MMLAHVRSTYSLSGNLESVLSTDQMKRDLASDGTLSVCTSTGLQPQVHVSIHQRNWMYEDDGGSLGPIEVRHLWLAI